VSNIALAFDQCGSKRAGADHTFLYGVSAGGILIAVLLLIKNQYFNKKLL
jgi:hypothetical protein